MMSPDTMAAAHRASRSAAFESGFLEELASILGAPRSGPSPIGWSVVLTPEHVDAGLVFPPRTLVRYQRVGWSEPIEAGPYRLETAVQWCSARSADTEMAISSRALRADRVVAQSLVVGRFPGRFDSWGERKVPAVPRMAAASPGQTFVINADEVSGLAEACHVDYRLNHDLRFAHDVGYPNALVPAPLLMARLAAHGALPPGGTMEAWFQRPVPVGSALRLGQLAEGGAESWVVSLVGREEPAVTVRIRPCR